MEQNSYFREYLDSIFKYSNVFSQEEYERHCSAFETNYGRFMPQDRKSKILDIGCGAGHFLYFLSNR